LESVGRQEAEPIREQEGPVAESKPFVILYLKRVVLGPWSCASAISQLFRGGFPPVFPGIYQGVPITLEEIFDHLPFQNVFKHLWRDFSRDQTLFQNPQRCGIQVVSEFSAYQVHTSPSFLFKLELNGF
jgi:hypothetical protein